MKFCALKSFTEMIGRKVMMTMMKTKTKCIVTSTTTQTLFGKFMSSKDRTWTKMTKQAKPVMATTVLGLALPSNQLAGLMVERRKR